MKSMTASSSRGEINPIRRSARRRATQCPSAAAFATVSGLRKRMNSPRARAQPVAIDAAERGAMGNIESVMQENRVFPPSAEFVKQANISGMDAYRAMLAEAEKDFEGFWARQATARYMAPVSTWRQPSAAASALITAPSSRGCRRRPKP